MWRAWKWQQNLLPFKKRSIAIIGLGIIAVLFTVNHFIYDIYEETSKENKAARYVFEKPREKPICIEDNICKDHPSDEVYIYRRKPNFIQRIDDNIKDVLNITHPTYVVPNLVHFVQYTDVNENKTDNDFEFHHMLSVLSVYKMQRSDRIYFWLDQEPKSKFWIRLKQKVPMYLIYRERPTSIRGRRVHFITKVSNIIRMEAIIEYGGMYFDLDVVVVKSLDPLRIYDATMGHEAHNQFCNGVLIGKPWADFFRKWHQEHKTLDENVWSYHSGLLPYLLSQKYPSLVHAEKKSFFRPAGREIDYLFKEGQLYDWRKNNYCVHLWIRQFKGHRREDSEIDGWNTTVGEVFRYIVYDDWRLRK